MTVFSPPPFTRNIGTVLIAGKPVTVQGDISWLRFWAQSLYDRVGGATGASNTELAALISALTSAVSVIDGSVDTLQTGLADVVLDVSAIQTALNTAQADITALALRVTALELATMQTAMQYDYIDATTSYRGEAVPGTATSAALWRVQRITITGDDLVIEWADGSSDFTQIWDDRLSLTYS